MVGLNDAPHLSHVGPALLGIAVKPVQKGGAGHRLARGAQFGTDRAKVPIGFVGIEIPHVILKTGPRSRVGRHFVGTAGGAAHGDDAASRFPTPDPEKIIALLCEATRSPTAFKGRLGKGHGGGDDVHPPQEPIHADAHGLLLLGDRKLVDRLHFRQPGEIPAVQRNGPAAVPQFPQTLPRLQDIPVRGRGERFKKREKGRFALPDVLDLGEVGHSRDAWRSLSHHGDERENQDENRQHPSQPA